jgi:hypothetical protein
VYARGGPIFIKVGNATLELTARRSDANAAFATADSARYLAQNA